MIIGDKGWFIFGEIVGEGEESVERFREMGIMVVIYGAFFVFVLSVFYVDFILFDINFIIFIL